MTKASPVTQEDVEQYRQELLRKHEPAIRPFLQPGEAVRAIVMADIDSTVKKPPLRYLPKEGQIDQWIERSNRVSNAVDYGTGNALWGVASFIFRIPAPMKGGWQSEAGRFAIVVSGAARKNRDTFRHLCLAVTDLRVLLLTQPSTRSQHASRPVRLLGEYFPDAIGLRPGWRLNAGSGHVDLGFADGSYVSIDTDLPIGAALLAQLLSPPVI